MLPVSRTIGSLVPPELLGRLNRRMQNILTQLQETSPDHESRVTSAVATAAGVTGADAQSADSWDASANQRWQDILARIQADASEAALRGASLGE
eukprot:SAG31_NODE_955_length_10799_cov_6.576636_10_plen_95_part_00